MPSILKVFKQLLLWHSVFTALRTPSGVIPVHAGIRSCTPNETINETTLQSYYVGKTLYLSKLDFSSYMRLYLSKLDFSSYMRSVSSLCEDLDMVFKMYTPPFCQVAVQFSINFIENPHSQFHIFVNIVLIDKELHRTSQIHSDKTGNQDFA